MLSVESHGHALAASFGPVLMVQCRICQIWARDYQEKRCYVLPTEASGTTACSPATGTHLPPPCACSAFCPTLDTQHLHLPILEP